MSTGESDLAKISIEYCGECGDAGVALRAAEELLSTYEDRIAELALLPGWNGVFEVTVNGKLIFSKTKLGRHAYEGELVRLLDAEL